MQYFVLISPVVYFKLLLDDLEELFPFNTKSASAVAARAAAPTATIRPTLVEDAGLLGVEGVGVSFDGVDVETAGAGAGGADAGGADAAAAAGGATGAA